MTKSGSPSDDHSQTREPSFVDVLASSDLPEGGKRAVHHGGRELVLVRVDGVAWALDNLCPHRGGALSDGDLQGHHLYCPLHAWCFDVRTGEGFFPPGARVEAFVVRERGGRVLVARADRPVPAFRPPDV